MMLTAFNAVNLVASDINNRRNNNNNNNNDNNDNNNQDNTANTDAEIENPNNMIFLPPIPGRSLYSKNLVMRRSISSFHLEELKPSLYGNTYSAFIDILKGSLRFQVEWNFLIYL